MSFGEIYLLTYGIILACMTVLWFVSVIIKNVSIVDIFWGAGFVVTAFSYFALTDGFMPRKILITALVTIWGLRLTLHLARRNLGKGEDFRYQAFRRRFGESYWWISFFQTFVLQGTLMVIISAPLLAAQYSPQPDNLTLVDFLGVIIWGAGFFFEAVGDWQLTRFRANPANKGKVLDTGLWRYTRHPNYFGDAVAWWGYFLIALAAPNGFLTIYGPLLMTFFLVRVSGVALLEKSLATKKPDYQDYIRRTSAFIPRPPRRS